MAQALNHIKPGDPIVVAAGNYTGPAVFQRTSRSGALYCYPLYPGNPKFYSAMPKGDWDAFHKVGRLTSQYNVHLSAYQRVYKITEDNLVELDVFDDYKFLKKTLGL